MKAVRTVHHLNLVQGRWQPSSDGATCPNENPARTNETLGLFPRSTEQDAATAVEAAHEAVLTWRRTFGFTRGMPQYLDGFEDAAVAWHRLEDERYAERFPIVLPEHSEVFAVVRVNPDDKARTAVIHLVDWSRNSEPFILTLDVERVTDKGDLDYETL